VSSASIKSIPTSADSDVGAAVDALRRILRSLRLAARMTEAKAGLSAAQLYVLSTVASAGEASVNELATRTMTDRSSVASVIDRLTERGLVVRNVAADDRRRAAVRITAAGTRALRRAPEPPTQLVIDALRSMPPDQLSDAARGLTALTVAMGIASGPAGMFFEDAPRSRAKRVKRGAR
jgi:DNA-binding MarR family transcriptional regulator